MRPRKLTGLEVQLCSAWERASCERFRRDASGGTLVIVPQSNHYVFLVSPEQTFVAMTRWLRSVR